MHVIKYAHFHIKQQRTLKSQVLLAHSCKSLLKAQNTAVTFQLIRKRYSRTIILQVKRVTDATEVLQIIGDKTNTEHHRGNPSQSSEQYVKLYSYFITG